MAKWVCNVCGYVHEGETAPEACPVCKAPASKFTKQDEGMTWAAEHVVGVAKGAPEDIIEDCSVEDAKAKTFAEFEAELKEKGFLNPSEEDVLSYALFPQVAEEFFQKHYQKVTAYKRS